MLLLTEPERNAHGQFSSELRHPYQREIEQAENWRDQQPDRAIALLEQTIQSARKNHHKNSPAIAALYDSLAYVHESRWHILYALNALAVADQLAPAPARQHHIHKLQDIQREMEAEHRQQREYRPTKDSGPARNLSGKIVIADIYVDTGVRSRWGNKDRLLARQATANVEAWLIEQAKRWSAPAPAFVAREFNVELKLRPSLGQLDFLEAGGLDIAIKQLGHERLGDFIQQLAVPDDADQVAIVLHVSVDRRSYARSCHGRQAEPITLSSAELNRLSCLEEYAVVASKVEHNDWAQFSHTKAHEVLHLFGADDLYNKAGGEEYLATDIMHYRTKRLSDADIEQLTAWAIGWPAEKPTAPFNIID